jgi:hypothetical protein
MLGPSMILLVIFIRTTGLLAKTGAIMICDKLSRQQIGQVQHLLSLPLFLDHGKK